jgi:hypothetical protein
VLLNRENNSLSMSATGCARATANVAGSQIMITACGRNNDDEDDYSDDFGELTQSQEQEALSNLEELERRELSFSVALKSLSL